MGKAPAFNLSTQEAKAGESHSAGDQPGLWNEFKIASGTFVDSAQPKKKNP